MAGTEPRRPLHVITIVGLSTSIYAVSLAGVMSMQAASDGATADQQAQSQATLDVLRTHDASVAREINGAATKLQAGASSYAQAGQALADLERRLAGLGKSAGALSALPAIPTVHTPAAVPVIHATSGASGAKP